MPDLPHAQRQIDTLGVSLRYWLRWTVESGDAGFFLPAVLDRGHTLGIQPMEFPLLNILGAPAFVFGPYWGVVIAQLIGLALQLGLWWLVLRVWRGQFILGIDAGRAFFYLPLISISSLYFGRFIPDLPAFLCVLVAVGLSWKQPRILSSFIFLTLGLLMKPTAIIVLVLLLLRRIDVRTCLWTLGGIVLGAAYYKFGLAFVKTFQETPDLFYVGFRNPLVSLRQFFAHPFDILNLYNLKWIADFVPLLAFFFWVKAKTLGASGGLVLLMTLQILAIGALDGEHSFVHEYYYIGISCTGALFFFMSLTTISSPYYRIFLLVLLLIRLLDRTTIVPVLLNLRITEMYRECDDYRRRMPEVPWGKAAVFGSSSEPYPKLGLCLGERVKEGAADYYIGYAKDKLPRNCDVLQSRHWTVLAKCSRP